jgi:dTDP-glucose pyrophosphorylase
VKVLVPIAALDSFFKRDEFFYPKPLIDVDGQPMIARAVECLQRLGHDLEFIFVARSEDCQQFSLDNVLRLITHGRCQIVQLKNPTRGAVCSCLMAIDHISAEEPLVVANGDQIIDTDLSEIVGRLDASYDAGVITFESVHPRWSYVLADDTGLVLEAAEKRVISSNAIAGFYWFATGDAFVKAAMRLIEHDVQHNGAYYIAPTLNELILAGKQVGHVRIPVSAYHSFYSPQKVEEYQRIGQRQGAGSPATSPIGPVNIVIPMAGRGSRFRDAGYTKPKPFIEVDGKTMIERVLENLAVPNAQFILIAQQEHLDAEPKLAANLSRRPNVRIVPMSFVTEGSACTVLMARPHIDNDAPLLIANCDQLVDMSVADFVRDCHDRGLDGSILCFRDPTRHPKWSFAKVADDGLVVETREKVAISDLATVGMYYFSRGSTFVAAATDMIVRNDRVNNEFYTCPVYNYAIGRGGRIGTFNISMEAMHGLGTPEDLKAYLGRTRPS